MQIFLFFCVILFTILSLGDKINLSESDEMYKKREDGVN